MPMWNHRGRPAAALDPPPPPKGQTTFRPNLAPKAPDIFFSISSGVDFRFDPLCPCVDAKKCSEFHGESKYVCNT